ncbi:beta-ketoacyl synthase N-terminal-like domain-containing protein [Anaeromicropila populeti]|uniref:Beta-ketoacyl synthase, N-terminal domain n=1 Tax=Anaeromicropila populeti TaxID=37658 RepID=A0A1I6HS63_9FIRM|nr:beta-ketoacyl synthase N-terminal-like domain-containing protein [Anaeromicropila populeti]SFR57263.1 Beta-ketoacyl synthase, N-terminal domain [Anaeromicropila populeti]
MHKFNLLPVCVYTLEGEEFISVQKDKMDVNKRMLQPKVLRGLAPKIDWASALVVLASELFGTTLADLDHRYIGVCIGTVYGNHLMAKSYSDKIRRGAVSPTSYSVSGYNMCASLTALAYQFQGPSIVIPGCNTSFGDLLLIGSNYLHRGDAEAMIVGKVDIDESGTWGMSSLTCIIKNETADAPYQLVLGSDVTAADVTEENADIIEKVSKHSQYMADTVIPFLFTNEQGEQLHQNKICDCPSMNNLGKTIIQRK